MLMMLPKDECRVPADCPADCQELDATQIAAMRRVSVKTINRELERGAIPSPHTPPGKPRRWSRAVIEEYMRARINGEIG